MDLPPITVLLATREAGLAAQIAALRPDWQVDELGGALPSPADVHGAVWSIADWLLPDISGLELCRRLRSTDATRHGRILVIVEADDLVARRRALQAGADDYLVAPVSAEDLVERIGRANAFQPHHAGERLVHGEIVLDLDAWQARIKGETVVLRLNEFRLLAHFMRYPDKVMGRAAIIAGLGKDATGIDERTVDVWIGRLRRSLIARGVRDPIRTVRSIGYILDSIV